MPMARKALLPLERESADKEAVDPKIRWKKKSILWELPYWVDLVVHHSIDDIYVKKMYVEVYLEHS